MVMFGWGVYRGRKWKQKSLVNLMKKMEPAVKKQHRLVLTNRWKMSKKSSSGARISNAYRSFSLFRVRQAFLTEIPTFNSILRVVSIDYNMEKSFSKSTLEGLKILKDLEKKEHAVITCTNLAATRVGFEREPIH